MREHPILKIFLVMLAAVFIFNQIYTSVYKPITTESAVFYNAVDGLNITGLIIRREHLVNSSSGGIMHYVAGNGTRVAKGGIIASIYDSEAASITVSEIETVKKQISDMEALQAYNDLQASDLELINNKVKDNLNTMITQSSNGNFDSVEENKTNMLSVINRRQMITGVATDFSSQLAELNSRLSSLTASLPAAKGTVYADESGYFVSTVDGYENALTCDELEKITPEYISGIKAEAVDKTAIGKIVSDYEWYIAAEVSINESLKYKVGDALTIHTATKSNPILSATVKKINMSSEGSKAVIVFSCNQMDNELASMRTGPMTVVNTTYSGLKVNKKALRVRAEDSQTGVYVVSGMQIKFIPVTVIYSTDEYIICEQKQTTEQVLRLYDEVVVKGKNLYDEKIVG